MITWINLMESSGAILSDSMLIAKALKFGKNFPEFKASRGWLEKFKLRNAIKLRKYHGDSGSVNHDEKSITDFNETMRLKIEQYGLDNVYNADETGETIIEEESNEKKVDLSEAFRALEIIKTYASQIAETTLLSVQENWMVKIISEHYSDAYKAFIPALYKTSMSHWSQNIKVITLATIRQLSEMNGPLFQQSVPRLSTVFRAFREVQE
ncbi:uncharacterized protein LOC115228538 [Octopus sinensis]|uniref:Uncharacterized protein LOC115228538 n=1 Tax=Octopus sinensis TaxID=2607531 RepID=A0A6P7TT90_9MOLL|nr:uncharacterized protein LOC115228538 [Octopus sinensis]